MSDSSDPRVTAAELRASHGDQAATEALILMALANADGDHAAVFRWEQVFGLLMGKPDRDLKFWSD